MKHIFISVAFLICAVVAQAEQLPFKSGESLAYAVYYRAKMVPRTPVGRATLVCESESYMDEPHYKITANGRTLPFFRWFYDLNDTYISYIDSVTMRPSKLLVRLDEDGYRFGSTYLYDWRTHKVYTSYKKHNQTESQRKTQHLPQGAYDPVALFYNLRKVDFATLKVGEQCRLDMVLEDTIRQLIYTYEGRDVTQVKGTGDVASLRFRCSIATSSGQSFKDGAYFTLWVSDDRNRIPLVVDSPVKVGSVGAYLIEYSNLREELRPIRK